MLRWTSRLDGAPVAYGSAAVTVEHKVYCFVDFWDNDSDRIDVHVFNTVSLRWTKLPPETTRRGERPPEVPSGRRGHTAVLIEDAIYVWGGRPYCNRLYAFDVDAHKWLKPKSSGAVPEARYNHSTCVLGKVMYIHAGYTQMGHTDSMYKLDTATMVWALVNAGGTPTAASSGHSATIIGTNMFVFAGREGQRNYYNSVRVFDTKTNLWLSAPSTQLLPEGRRFHSAFAYNGELYIIGGEKSSQIFSDLWKFIPETFSWRQVEPKGKGPRSGMPGMCCCMVGDCVIIFGGWDLNTPDDLYILDLSPSLKTLSKLAVLQYGLEQSELPLDIRWDLAAMTNRNRK